MNSSRTLSAFVLTISATLATCGGGNGNGGPGGGFQACPTTGSNTCTQAEINQYTQCLQNACASAYSQCFGPGWMSGNYSGVCQSWIQCTSQCGCNNQSCSSACGLPQGECQSCLLGSAQCSQTCTPPACYGTGGFDGGIPGFDGGIPGFDAGSHTCAQFLTCCNGMSGQGQSQCMTLYNAAVAGGDAACSIAYGVAGCQ